MGRVPYAVVVLRSGTQISADELISWTKDRLAHYKRPVGVTFAPSLARTASGKLQKQAIRSSLGPRPSPPTHDQCAVRSATLYAICVPAASQLHAAGRPGALAQLVERLHGMQEVRGSNPLSSTIFRIFVRV
jgi:hypothetical protein